MSSTSTTGLNTIVYPVSDLAAAKAVYTRLLGEPHTDQPYYVGFRVGGQEIGLDPNGHAKGITGALGYWDVADVAGELAALVAAGATAHQDVQDVGGGTLLASVTDPDGNLVGLIQRA